MFKNLKMSKLLFIITRTEKQVTGAYGKYPSLAQIQTRNWGT